MNERILIQAILVFSLMAFAIEVGAAAKCCSLGGGGASYNYLGDPSMDMDSFDEFLRGNDPLPGSVFRSDARTAKESRIKLNLNDGSHVDISLSKKGDQGYTGSGNITKDGSMKPISASANIEKAGLLLKVSLEGGSVYTFNLAVDNASVNGPYSQISPGRESLTGTAVGTWEK
jgi:hypothetical protein